MAKKIIILDRSPSKNFRVAFWLDVPLSRRSFYANIENTSQFVNADAAEIAALRGGSVTEQIAEFGRDVEGDLAAVKTFLITQHNARQARVNALNNWARYGSNWDGTDWTAGGVA